MLPIMSTESLLVLPDFQFPNDRIKTVRFPDCSKLLQPIGQFHKPGLRRTCFIFQVFDLRAFFFSGHSYLLMLIMLNSLLFQAICPRLIVPSSSDPCSINCRTPRSSGAAVLLLRGLPAAIFSVHSYILCRSYRPSPTIDIASSGLCHIPRISGLRFSLPLHSPPMRSF